MLVLVGGATFKHVPSKRSSFRVRPHPISDRWHFFFCCCCLLFWKCTFMEIKILSI